MIAIAAAWAPHLPQRPEPCLEVAGSEALHRRLAETPPPGALCLAPGEYSAPIALHSGVIVWGPASAVIRSSGSGTTVRLEGEGAALLGVTVDGAGARFDLLDAAVHVQGVGHRVEGVTIRRASFGILVERSRGAAILGNDVEGIGGEHLGLRGDGIRLWETRGSTIADNLVRGSRDVVVWYSNDNVVRKNVVLGSRYGAHLMYSHRNVIEENRFEDDVVGVFLMYSRQVRLARNLIAGASGSAGIGIGVKESGDLEIVDNTLLRNTTGLYLDTSPLDAADSNRIEGNALLLGEIGVLFHKSERRNTFLRNQLRDNLQAVSVDGGGDALGVEWSENEFDDYAGYDLDGDGFGDIPYEMRSLSADLIARYPSLALLRGSPALFVVDAASRIVPLFAPKTLLVDRRPSMGRGARDAN